MTVNDAVAKRIIGLLSERNMTQYRLEQNAGILHGSMHSIINGKTNDVQLGGKQFNGIGICLGCTYKIELLRLGKGLVAPADLLGQRRDCYSLAVGCNGCHTCQKGCKQFLHKDNIDGYLIESDHYCVQRYEINRNNALQ